MPTVRDHGAPPAHAPPAIPPSRYILGAEIARGGMGRVVEATDTLLGRVVALKEALSSDPESLERFARETRITARLEHPSIVPVHDGGTGPNGMPYYVMRKIAGRPLERLVAQSDSLGDRLRLVRHMVASAEAIAHAHERGIVHRDIKPSNILVGELGETIVIDWGLAKVLDEADDPPAAPTAGAPVSESAPTGVLRTRAGIVFGTPGFMAPEQLRGGAADPRWDVYALGATLYHLLSKKPPHYATSAEEMNRATAAEPATPIAELVPGVPPELATIVDKALAFDPERRYQDARELARDLQRFLGGQLVASHHYTARERISRYLVKHRYAFIVGAAAVAALMIGGALAFVSIVNERDRADDNAVEARKAQKIAEQEKLVAERRTEDLSLAGARNLASTNPTLALALVKPLVASRWREVRAIAAEARASGVAWGLPASPSVRSLVMARDGRRALAGGEDGAVRLYDLETHGETTLIAAGAPVSAIFADDDRRVVAWGGTHVAILDIGASGRRDLEVDTAIVALAVVGTTVYWIDARSALWQLELAAVAPRQLPLDDTVTALAASPDGRWLALAGTDHLLLYDREAPTTPVVTLASGRAHALDWAADGSRLAALVGGEAVEVVVDPAPRVVQRTAVGERSHVVASGARVVTIGPTGVGLVSAPARSRTRLVKPIGLDEARGGIIVAGAEDQLLVLTDYQEHALVPPSGRFSKLCASPASSYVVAVAGGRLLAWNLDRIAPRVAGTQIATAKFVTGDDLVATTLGGPAQWIDLASGNRRDLGAWPALLDVVVSPSGRHAVAIDMAHTAHLLEAGKPPLTIAGAVDRAGFATDTQLVLATDDGAIDVYDVTTRVRSPLRAKASALASIAWSPEVVAAHLADGGLWRTRLAGREPTTTPLPRAATTNLLVTSTGDAFIAIGAELLRWPASARDPVLHAKLPASVGHLAAIGEDHLIASGASTTYLVALATPAVTDLEGSALDSLEARASVSTTGLVVVLDHGAIDVIDPRIQPARWRLASGQTFVDVQIANDGRRILAKAGSTLLVWDLGLPSTAAETATWLDGMTNAVATSGVKSLGWR